MACGRIFGRDERALVEFGKEAHGILVRVKSVRVEDDRRNREMCAGAIVAKLVLCALQAFGDKEVSEVGRR